MNISPIWWLTVDGDLDCLDLFGRSSGKLITRSRDKLLLRTRKGDAAFGWRKVTDANGKHSINCAAFRNESGHESAELVRQADRIADFAWPDCRHYTSIDTDALGADNDGVCFSDAGWKKASEKKTRFVILEYYKPKLADKYSHDSIIAERKRAGQTNLAISVALGVHKWIVDDACKRLNIVEKDEFHETPIRYNKVPLVQKTCPSCRKKHMSDPKIWTCAECKEDQERENAGATDTWY